MLQELRNAQPRSRSPSKSEGDAGLTQEAIESVGFGMFGARALGVGSSSGSRNALSLRSGLLFSFCIIARRALLNSALASRFAANSCSSHRKRSSASISGCELGCACVADAVAIIEEGESGVM